MKSALAFGLAFALSFGLTLCISHRQEDRSHVLPQLLEHPRSGSYLGGIAIYLASVSAMVATRTGENTAFPADHRRAGYPDMRVIDDLWPPKPWQKFIGQVVSAGWW